MKRSAIRRRSPLAVKRTVALAKASKAVAERANYRCEIRFDGNCERFGSHAHHTQGRIGTRLTNIDRMLWACSSCHRAVHAHPELSYERGWLRKRTAS